jgi:ubiquinone/menaquinone biosynthesis C-methylase UbiE
MLKLYTEDRNATTPEGRRGFWMTSLWKARRRNLALHDPLDQARSEFDAWSRTYDQSLLQRFFFGPSHRLMLSHLSQADTRILDVGCGTGKWAEMVLEAKPNAEVWGLDLSAEMLQKAEQRASRFPNRLRLTQGDSESLPFETGFFDVITCSHSFHHYPHQGQVVAEMRRVLKPGGRMMIVDGCRDTWWGWFIFDGLVTWAEGHVHHCSKRRMKRLMKETGLENIRQTSRKYTVPYLLTIACTPTEVKPRLKLAA